MKSKINIRQISFIFMLFLILTMMVPTQVYAGADRANAVSDIMNDARFEGAIDSIEWLTTRIDHWFTMFITATAFFIISASLLKNACAGAYCANHKFFDKVAEAHESAEAASISSIVGGLRGLPNMTGGSIKQVLLCLVPNIKAFTDFDDADIEPKHYFMKAIPQMLGCIIIGTFIYNGYYRDTAAMVGSMGSEICTRVFASVDPGDLIDRLSQTTGTPENIYANDETQQGKDMLAISSALYTACNSRAKNMTAKEQKEELMRNCEFEASKIIKSSEMSKFYADERVMDFSAASVKVTVVTTPPTSSSSADAPHVETIDTKTNSKFSVNCYGDAPEPAKTLISDDGTLNYYYCSFIMVGSTKTNNRSMISDIVAEAGKNSSGTTTAITKDSVLLSASAQGWANECTITGNTGEIDLQKVGANHYNATAGIPADKLWGVVSGQVGGGESYINKVLADGTKIVPGSVTVGSVNGGGGTANHFNETVTLGSEAVGVTLKVTLNFKYTRDSDSNTEFSGSHQLNLQIKFTN